MHCTFPPSTSTSVGAKIANEHRAHTWRGIGLGDGHPVVQGEFFLAMGANYYYKDVEVARCVAPWRTMAWLTVQPERVMQRDVSLVAVPCSGGQGKPYSCGKCKAAET